MRSAGDRPVAQHSEGSVEGESRYLRTENHFSPQSRDACQRPEEKSGPCSHLVTQLGGQGTGAEEKLNLRLTWLPAGEAVLC